MKVTRQHLVAGGVGFALGVGVPFGVDAYRDWSLERRCEQQKREVAIFVDDTATPEEIAALERELSENRDIDSVEYVSREEAFEEFKELYKDDPHLYRTIDADDLPSAFRLVAANESAVTELYELEDPAIDEIRGGEAGALGFKCLLKSYDEDPRLNP